MTSSTRNTRYLSGALPGSLLAVLRSVCCVLKRWYCLDRQRRQLASLSDAALKDLGLSRADIEQETQRPFWDDPLGR